VAFQAIALGMGLSAVAMAFAAAGYLAPLAGALVQEGIDVAAILYALTALRAGRGERDNGRDGFGGGRTQIGTCAPAQVPGLTFQR
jgi:hypothetical protein